MTLKGRLHADGDLSEVHERHRTRVCAGPGREGRMSGKANQLSLVRDHGGGLHMGCVCLEWF